MAETYDPRSGPLQPATPPGPFLPPAARPPAPRNTFLGCAFALSFLLNVVAGLVLLVGCLGMSVMGLGNAADFGNVSLAEHTYAGSALGRDKVAIVRLEGLIMEGLLEYVHKQIEQAAKDDHVKAVVLRVNSPGGSITASDELYRRLVELRDGSNPARKSAPKPLVVSMGSLTASGGYYVSMPGQTLLAERTTMTGSIGVYASFPNVAKLANEHGVEMITVKQGEIKTSGSPFHGMSDKERQVFQDMVDHAYNQFLEVVETGRPALKGQLLTPLDIKPVHAGPPRPRDAKPDPLAGGYQRYRADGGIFTADKALEYGLIDRLGYLDDAIATARKAANLGDDAPVIEYEKKKTLTDLLLGVRASTPASVLDLSRLAAGLTPRLWYLAPGAEAAGMLAAMGKNAE